MDRSQHPTATQPPTRGRKRSDEVSLDSAPRILNGKRENGQEVNGKLQRMLPSKPVVKHFNSTFSLQSNSPRPNSFYPGSAPGQAPGGLPVIVSSAVAQKRKQYFAKWSHLMELEFTEELKDIEMRFRLWSTDKLVRDGFSLLDLSVRISGFLVDDILLKFCNSNGTDLPFHRLAVGDMVSIQAQRSSEGQGDRADGVVVERSRSFLLVAVKEPPSHMENYLWRVDKGANRVNFDRCLRAIGLMTSSETTDLHIGSIPQKFIPMKDQRKILRSIFVESTAEAARALADKPSSLQELHLVEKLPKEFHSWSLNESQRRTIVTALGRTLTLIQGPPGTGKTHTAVHLIKLLTLCYKDHNLPILACAYTNVATDNLLEGLLSQGVKALRVGRPVKVRPELRDATLDSQMEIHPRREDLRAVKDRIIFLNSKLKQQSGGDIAALQRDLASMRSRQRELQKNIISDIMKSAPVICCTCIGAGDDILKDVRCLFASKFEAHPPNTKSRLVYFPFVIMDECTQASEPAVLVPLSNSCPLQVVMIGDHHQLPPTVKSDEASKAGLSTSLFSRLIQEAHLQVSMLEVQYRMHPMIAEFPSNHFYDGQLKTGIASKDRPPVPGFNWRPECPVAFIQISSPEQKTYDSKSKFNDGEASTLCTIVKQVLGAGLPRSAIGIITPYSAQVKRIYDILSKDKSFQMQVPDEAEAIEDAEWRESLQLGFSISSVDGFQGREKDLIIFSAVRSNSLKKLGFLTDWRRLNVALTRARRGLIVLGNRDTLINDEHWAKFFQFIDSHNLTQDSDDFLTLIPPNPKFM